jgi:hypothetical protein
MSIYTIYTSKRLVSKPPLLKDERAQAVNLHSRKFSYASPC